MLNKKITVLAIFLVSLLSISVVCATDSEDITGDENNLDASDSSVFIEEVNATVGLETPLVAKVTSDNSTVNDGIVTFYDNDSEIGNSSVASGIASLSFVPQSAGLHTIKAIFTSDKYLSSNFTRILNVSKANVEISIDQIPPTYSNEYTIISVSIFSNSKPINEGSLDYYVNGRYIGTGYIYNGMQRMIYRPDSTGACNLEVIFEGTDNYWESSENTTFSVIEKTNITASNVTTVYNGGKYLVATLSDASGNPINNTTLTIKINGNLKSFKTDSNGQVRFLTNGLAPNTYNAVITFNGNDNYKNSTLAVKVIVKKTTPKLTAKNKLFKLKTKTKKYVIYLKNNNAKVMKNVKVTLKVNGKTYKAFTNKKGKATFKITKLNKIGKFKATIRYAGNKYYNPLKKSVWIAVKK